MYQKSNCGSLSSSSYHTYSLNFGCWNFRASFTNIQDVNWKKMPIRNRLVSQQNEFSSTLYWSLWKSHIAQKYFFAWTATGLISYDLELVVVKKSLRTGSIKSFSSTSPIFSNSMHHFFSFSQIPLFAISIIPLSKNLSYHKAESTFSQSSYL